MSDDLENFSLKDLRAIWSSLWNMEPPKQLGLKMLTRSILFKRAQLAGDGLNIQQEASLAELIKQYKVNPKIFSTKYKGLYYGTRLSRAYRGKIHIVIVRSNHFEYQKNKYQSLSSITSVITGKKSEGKKFFGL